MYISVVLTFSPHNLSPLVAVGVLFVCLLVSVCGNDEKTKRIFLDNVDVKSLHIMEA